MQSLRFTALVPRARKPDADISRPKLKLIHAGAQEKLHPANILQSHALHTELTIFAYKLVY